MGNNMNHVQICIKRGGVKCVAKTTAVFVDRREVRQKFLRD